MFAKLSIFTPNSNILFNAILNYSYKQVPEIINENDFLEQLGRWLVDHRVGRAKKRRIMLNIQFVFLNNPISQKLLVVYCNMLKCIGWNRKVTRFVKRETVKKSRPPRGMGRWRKRWATFRDNEGTCTRDVWRGRKYSFIEWFKNAKKRASL